nr:putative ribonuclease H-like domain-containing protein [Tanacetum cinerariifolium]
MVAAAKLPVLYPNEFELWKMRIEQYFLMTDYALCEVIINGDSLLLTRSVEGVETPYPPTTVEEKLARKNELKARVRSLPSEWKTHTLVWRNKPDMETLSMDDLYNNLKVYKDEVTGSSSTTQNIQNVAFVSSNNTNSTNKAVNITHGVFAAYSKTNASNLPNVDSLSDVVIYSFFASQSNSLLLDNEDLKQIDLDDLEEIDLKWATKHQDNRNREAPRKIVPVKDTTSNALISQCDGLGYDWSDQAKDGPTNFPFMAYTSSSSSSSDTKVNTDKGKVTTVGTKAVVSVIQGNRENAVKSSACWIYRPTGNVIDHTSKDSGSYMLKRFNYVDLQGRLKSVKQKDDGIFISQDKYVADILKIFDFTIVKTASTPMEPNNALIKDTEAEDVDVHLYRSMIGSLMYLTASRADIMFAVYACVRFQVTPKTSHLHAVKRIFRYLKGQSKLGLSYLRDSLFDFEAFYDSDYARASLDRKSTTRGCQFHGKRLISWQCKEKTIVVNSTTEVEYVTAASCCRQMLWIQNQMLNYGLNFMNTKIYIDHKSIICIVKNPVFHSKTKHIEIRHHFIRDSYKKKLIHVIKIHTDHNIADLLTKAFDFWTSAKVETVNEDVQLHALVDGKKVIVNEASIRCDLRLDDAKVLKLLPKMNLVALWHVQSSAWPIKKFNFSKYILDNMVKNLEAGVKFYMFPRFVQVCVNHQLVDMSHHKGIFVNPSLTKKGSFFGANQAAKIKKLKKRVKKLEGKKKKRTHGLKRLYKVRLSARVESSEVEEGLGDQEDASKHERIAKIDVDEDLSLINETVQDQGRMNDEDLFGVNDLDDDEVIVDVTAVETIKQNATVAEIELAEQLQAQEREQLSVEERFKLLAKLIESRRNYFAAKRAEEVFKLIKEVVVLVIEVLSSKKELKIVVLEIVVVIVGVVIVVTDGVSSIFKFSFVIISSEAVTFSSILLSNPPMKTSMSFLEFGTMFGHKSANSWNLLMGLFNLVQAILLGCSIPIGWAYAFHQDKASLVRVPVANVTLSSSAYLLREDTDSFPLFAIEVSLDPRFLLGLSVFAMVAASASRAAAIPLEINF